jgi:hypothetical protein
VVYQMSCCLLHELFAVRATNGRFRNPFAAVWAIKDHRRASGGLPKATDIDRGNPRRFSFSNLCVLSDDAFSYQFEQFGWADGTFDGRVVSRAIKPDCHARFLLTAFSIRTRMCQGCLPRPAVHFPRCTLADLIFDSTPWLAPT